MKGCTQRHDIEHKSKLMIQQTKKVQQDYAKRRC